MSSVASEEKEVMNDTDLMPRSAGLRQVANSRLQGERVGCGALFG